MCSENMFESMLTHLLKKYKKNRTLVCEKQMAIFLHFPKENNMWNLPVHFVVFYKRMKKIKQKADFYLLKKEIICYNG